MRAQAAHQLASGASGPGKLASLVTPGLAGHLWWTEAQGDTGAIGWTSELLGFCWAGGTRLR